MPLSEEDVRDFIRSHRRGVLATMRSDGMPQLSPVLVDADHVGAMLDQVQQDASTTARHLEHATTAPSGQVAIERKVGLELERVVQPCELCVSPGWLARTTATRIRRAISRHPSEDSLLADVRVRGLA